MAEVEKKDMVYVRLRDVGSLVNDTAQDITIVGKKPVHVERTPFINRAIAANVLVILEEKVAVKEIAEYDKARKLVLETEKKALEVKPKVATPIKPTVDTKPTTTGQETGEEGGNAGSDQGEDGNGSEASDGGSDASELGTDKAPVAEEAAQGEGEKGAEAPAIGTDAPAAETEEAADGADAPADGEEKPDYMAWTNDALTAELKSRKIDFSGASKKAEYAALLTMDDEK